MIADTFLSKLLYQALCAIIAVVVNKYEKNSSHDIWW
jgi:hypothetical protein